MAEKERDGTERERVTCEDVPTVMNQGSFKELR
jgi:hypothetical protein